MRVFQAATPSATLLRKAAGVLLPLLALSSTGLSGPAMARSYAPAEIISVLVDLSETWHNAGARSYNAQLLASVGGAIADATQRLPKPVAVRYHIIGTASLARQPVCNILFRPSLVGFGGSEPGVQPNFPRFRQYLRQSCPTVLLAQPFERTTEITAAIVTALEANAMTAASVPRTLLILSDFKEESAVRYRLSRTSLKGIRVVLLWRTLPEDLLYPGGLARRISYWRQVVKSHGGTAYAFADNAAVSTPAALQALLSRD